MSRIIFRNANLIDGERPSQSGATVVVEGERIASVTTDPQAPAPPAGEADDVVDLAGRSLMPGMASCHFHTIFENLTPVSAPSLGLHDPPAYLAMVALKNVQLALDCGVTSVHCSSTAYAIDASLKRQIDEGNFVGPRVHPGSHELMTSADIASGIGRNYYMQLGNLGIPRVGDGVDGVRSMVRDEIKQGAEIIKLSLSQGHNAGPATQQPNFLPDELDAAVRAAHKRGCKIRAHAATRDAVLECARAGVDYIDHADLVDNECIDAILEAGSAIVPSLLYTIRTVQGYDSGLFNAMFPGGEPPPMLADVMEDMRASSENLLGMLPELQRQGVPLLAGDDFGTSFIAHGEYGSELAFYVKQAGIAPLDVIAWATRLPAEAIGQGDELGTITAGKLADLVVVDGDPLVDIGCLEDRSRIEAVLKGGSFAKGSAEALAR